MFQVNSVCLVRDNSCCLFKRRISLGFLKKLSEISTMKLREIGSRLVIRPVLHVNKLTNQDLMKSGIIVLQYWIAYLQTSVEQSSPFSRCQLFVVSEFMSVGYS